MKCSRWLYRKTLVLYSGHMETVGFVWLLLVWALLCCISALHMGFSAGNDVIWNKADLMKIISYSLIPSKCSEFIQTLHSFQSNIWHTNKINHGFREKLKCCQLSCKCFNIINSRAEEKRLRSWSLQLMIKGKKIWYWLERNRALCPILTMHAI